MKDSLHFHFGKGSFSDGNQVAPDHTLLKNTLGQNLLPVFLTINKDRGFQLIMGTRKVINTRLTVYGAGYMVKALIFVLRYAPYTLRHALHAADLSAYGR